MAWHRSPMTIYFKSRGTGFLTVLQLFVPKILKTDYLSTSCEHKHFYWTKLNRFHQIIRMALQWHYTEAPWPFISKVVELGFDSFAFISPKNYKNWFFINFMWTKTFLFSQIEQVPSDYTYGVAMALHRSPMTIYFKSALGFLTVLQLFVPKNRKTDFLSTSGEQKHLY